MNQNEEYPQNAPGTPDEAVTAEGPNGPETVYLTSNDNEDSAIVKREAVTDEKPVEIVSNDNQNSAVVKREDAPEDPTPTTTIKTEIVSNDNQDSAIIFKDEAGQLVPPAQKQLTAEVKQPKELPTTGRPELAVTGGVALGLLGAGAAMVKASKYRRAQKNS